MKKEYKKEYEKGDVIKFSAKRKKLIKLICEEYDVAHTAFKESSKILAATRKRLWDAMPETAPYFGIFNHERIEYTVERKLREGEKIL